MASYPQYEKYKPTRCAWLKEIPEHWDFKRIKDVATHNDEVLDERTDSDLEIGYVDISSVTLTKGIQKTESMLFEKAPSRARRKVKDGDIIVSTVRTYLKAIAPICNPPENMIVSTGFAVIRPKVNLYSGFAGYLLQSNGFVGEVVANSVGVSYPAINASDLVRIAAVEPPLDEQQAIAHFLDYKTAQIDALIAKKQALLAKLAEKRTALISHAVTKGLDPSVPMKDSGVEWLGEIPAHWRAKKAKYFATILRGKFSHRPRNDPRFYGGEYPFIQTGDVANADKYIHEYTQTLNEDGLKVSKKFPSGTLVMTIAANIGDIAVLNFDACFPDSIVGFVPQKSVNLNFLYYMFTAMRQQLLSIAVLNTQLNLNIERIGDQFGAFPPIDEQNKIVEHLDQTMLSMAKQVSLISTAINQLQEYRVALITHAVTGKIDVRGFVIPETSESTAYA